MTTGTIYRLQADYKKFRSALESLDLMENCFRKRKLIKKTLLGVSTKKQTFVFKLIPDTDEF